MLIQTYTMFGQPARVFPFRPNWQTPVIETLEWKTDVLPARDGSEQRRALRVNPRRAFEYGMLLKGEQVSMFEAYLWGWQSRHFALPVWTDIGKLTAGVTAGASSLPVVTATLGFRAADYALIYAGPKSYEVVEVDSFDSVSLTLADPVVASWPAGTKVYPLILSHLTDSVQDSRHTSAVGQVSSVAFNTSPDSAYSAIPGSSAGTLYDGIEVITHRPNWRAPISNEFTRQFDVADNGVGPVAYYQTEVTGRMVRPFQWFLRTRADIVEFRNLMGRLRGQAKSIWMPSWHDDFEVAASNSTDQTKLIVKGTWFHTLVGVDTSRDRLAIRLPNGTTLYRRITASAPNYGADTTQFTLDTTLGATVAPGDNSRVSLLLRCRLATDKIVIPWITDALTEPITAFTTIKL